MPGYDDRTQLCVLTLLPVPEETLGRNLFMKGLSCKCELHVFSVVPEC